MKYLSVEETEVSDISSTDFTDRAETKFSLLRLPSGKKRQENSSIADLTSGWTHTIYQLHQLLSGM